ncbi:uncharacterized protein DEA37_0005859 [Paragonimus westermani]|uniref:Uncharacterized protein n=1 Tax=Paragonimus westermani TaxID=34504 RepID=A0A5J4NBV2_9TREM|nr:uncharacterized protein DEA37_0005859 [Paragonimus westermani]
MHLLSYDLLGCGWPYCLRSCKPVQQEQSLSNSWIFSSSSFHVVSQLISGLLHICLPLFMELVNMLYLKKICDRIALLREIVPRDLLCISQPDPSKSALGSTVMDRVYALIFFVLFQLQWTIIGVVASNYKISHLLNVFSPAFMYACYAIEYRWRQVPGMLQTSDTVVCLLCMHIH